MMKTDETETRIRNGYLKKKWVCSNGGSINIDWVPRN